jgi:hypothetical protein
MAIDLVRDVFPGAECAWERTNRIPIPVIVVEATKKGKGEVGRCVQYEMCDDTYGPGVDALKNTLEAFKASNQ